MDFISEAITLIEQADEKIFLLLNGMHAPFFDKLMWAASDKFIWIPLYLLLAYFIMRRYSYKHGAVCLLFLVASVALTDYTCASVLRPAVERLRPASPDNALSSLVHIVNDYRGGRYGFPSCHAANSFAIAVFFSLCFRHRYITAAMLFWATLVAYSRIYLGVHYPGDILGGAFIGTLYALTLFRLFRISTSTRRIRGKAKKPTSCPTATMAILFLSVTAQAHSSAIETGTCRDSASINITDSICPLNFTADPCESSPAQNPYKFKPLQLIVPGTLIGVGIIGLESDWLKHKNKEIREELQENIDRKLTIDDISQYTPIATIYGLDLAGVKGLHDAIDQTIILGTSYLLMGITVNSLKTITKVERPDGSSRNSFPSGHTATAFMGAELLRREYWKVSPWIGVAGYAVAAGTGFFRIYNNRHWLTDVMAGAGIGILSAQAAYWLYPVITKALFRKRYYKNIYLSPYISQQDKGLTCRILF